MLLVGWLGISFFLQSNLHVPRVMPMGSPSVKQSTHNLPRIGMLQVPKGMIQGTHKLQYYLYNKIKFFENINKK